AFRARPLAAGVAASAVFPAPCGRCPALPARGERRGLVAALPDSLRMPAFATAVFGFFMGLSSRFEEGANPPLLQPEDPEAIGIMGTIGSDPSGQHGRLMLRSRRTSSAQSRPPRT